MHPAVPPSRTEAGFPGGFCVLMAVYRADAPDLFQKAVESVYANSLHPDQFVLAVDGPVPDPLRETIDRLAAKHGIEVLWLPENRGLAHALNEGLKQVTTTWVARADADDLNLPHRFEAQARALQQAPETDLFGSAILEVEPDGTPVAVRRLPTDHDRIRRYILSRSPFNHMTVVYRLQSVRQAGGYPAIHLKEDYGLWCRMAAQGARMANLPEILVHATAGRAMYRRRGGWKYAKAEVDMQTFLVDLKLKSRARALADGLLRSTIYLLPSTWRGWIYEKILRSSPDQG